jgi:hypothetical protein
MGHEVMTSPEIISVMAVHRLRSIIYYQQQQELELPEARSCSLITYQSLHGAGGTDRPSQYKSHPVRLLSSN